MNTTSASTSTAAATRPSLVPTALISAAFLLVAIVFVSSSSWYLTFKSLHVVFAVIWVGGGALFAVLGARAEFLDDPEEKLAVMRQAAAVSEKLFVPSSLIVLVMGIAMMLTDYGKAAFDWEQFWVVFGLLGFFSTFAIGLGLLSPTVKRLKASMEAHGPNAPETQTAISRLLLISRADLAVLLLVVVAMVAKPFL
jgi:uncharacterized membrane protein